MSTQRQIELPSRFDQRQPDLPQQSGVAQQPGLRGVCYNRKTGRWHAGINASGRSVNLGSYASEKEAACIYDKAALRIQGSEAVLNFSNHDYLLVDGSIALDLQVEALLIEAFLGRTGVEEPGVSQQQQSAIANAGVDEAPGPTASVGDLVRQCLGRINRADRTELQQAAEALGPGYSRLMSLITDAGQALAAAGHNAGGGSGAVHLMDGAGDDGSGSGGVESGGEGDWTEERLVERRSHSSQQWHLLQQQTGQQQQQQGGSWPGYSWDRAPFGTALAPAEHARGSQGNMQKQEPQYAAQHLYQQQQPHAQSQPTPSLRWQQQHSQPWHQHQLMSGGQEKYRPTQATVHGKDLPQHPQQQQQQQEVAMDVSMQSSSSFRPTHELTADRDHGKVPRNQIEAGGTGAGPSTLPHATPTDVHDTARDRATASAVAQEQKLLKMSSVAAGAPMPRDLLHILCNMIRQILESQPPWQHDPTRPRQPPLVQAVTQLASNGFPALLLMQAAKHLASTQVVPKKDYEMLEAVAAAVIYERVAMAGSYHRPPAPSAAMGPQQPPAQLRADQQHSHEHNQQQQLPHKPSATDTASMGAGTGGAAASSGGVSAEVTGLARSGIGVRVKRKSIDSGTAAPPAATARGESFPATVTTPATTAAYGHDGVPLSSKRQRMPDGLQASQQAGQTLAAVAGSPNVACRTTGADADMTTSMAMAAAAAAASTAGGVAIGFPSTAQDQVRVAAAMAAAATRTPVVPLSRGQMVMPGAAAQVGTAATPYRPPDGIQQPVSPTYVHHVPYPGVPMGGGAVSRGVSGQPDGMSRQHIGLGRRLFGAIASQLPPGAELNCLLTPKYGFVGVLYSVPGSTSVGASLWDGGVVEPLGEYSSERDARQAVESGSRMAHRMAAPAAAAGAGPTQLSAVAMAALRMPMASGGIPGRLSMMTSGTAAAAPPHVPTVDSAAEVASLTATAAAADIPTSLHVSRQYRVPFGGGSSIIGTATSGATAKPVTRVSGGRLASWQPSSREGRSGSAGSPSTMGPGSSGGGGGSAPTVIMRHSGTPGNPSAPAAAAATGPLVTVPSNKSLLSQGRSSVVPQAPAGTSTQQGSGGSKHEGGSGQQPLRGVQPVVAPMAAVTTSLGVVGELEAVGSSLPKGTVTGPHLIGPPEVAKDGSLQLVCQLVVQQDEPLSSDDVNNVINQRFTAANLQGLLEAVGADTVFAAMSAAREKSSGTTALSANLVTSGGATAPIVPRNPTVTTSFAGTSAALAPEPFSRHQSVLQQNQRQDTHTLAAKTPHPVLSGAAIPQPAPAMAMPPMPFALKGASAPTLNSPIDRDRDRDRDSEQPRDWETLRDDASVRGPLKLVPPVTSQQLPTSLQPLPHKNSSSYSPQDKHLQHLQRGLIQSQVQPSLGTRPVLSGEQLTAADVGSGDGVEGPWRTQWVKQAPTHVVGAAVLPAYEGDDDGSRDAAVRDDTKQQDPLATVAALPTIAPVPPPAAAAATTGYMVATEAAVKTTSIPEAGSVVESLCAGLADGPQPPLKEAAALAVALNAVISTAAVTSRRQRRPSLDFRDGLKRTQGEGHGDDDKAPVTATVPGEKAKEESESRMTGEAATTAQ